MGMRRRHGVGTIGMGGLRVAVRMAGVRMRVVRMRLMDCSGPELRLIAVGHPMLRAGLNGSARSDTEEESCDDDVRIRSDA